MICFGHFFKSTCEENDLRNIPLSRPGCFQCKWIHTQVVANWVTLLKNERELPWKVLRALVYLQFLSKQFNTEGGWQSGACRRVFLSRDRSKYDDSFSSPQIIFFFKTFLAFFIWQHSHSSSSPFKRMSTQHSHKGTTAIAAAAAAASSEGVKQWPINPTLDTLYRQSRLNSPQKLLKKNKV